MKLLLVAATEAEIVHLLAHLKNGTEALPGNHFRLGSTDLYICISGVGMMATSYNLAKALIDNNYDFALQAGVAGSFNDDIALGEIVSVQSEQYGDLGAEDHYNFLDIFELGLLGANDHPFSKGLLPVPPHPIHDIIQLRKVKSITVNTVSGSDFTIKARKEKFNPDIENMEGLAFHYVCLREKIPFVQVRSISNYVTPRDKDIWKMKDAIINLNEWLITFIENIKV